MWVVDYRTIHPRKFVFATFLKGFLWTGSIIQLNNEMLYHCLPILSMSSLQSPYHVPEIVIQHHPVGTYRKITVMHTLSPKMSAKE